MVQPPGKVLREVPTYHVRMSRAGRITSSLAVALCLLALAPAPPAQAQILTGRMSISADYELYGAGSLEGGGHVTWTLYDEQGAHLREKIVNLFDGYTQVPPGFVCEGSQIERLTAVPGNGIIELDEAKSYTDRLENSMEGSCEGGGYAGTPDRYIRVKGADLAERQLPVDRSTEGLVETTASSMGRFQIRFIFDVYPTTSESLRFSIGGSGFTDALHRVFDIDERSFLFQNAMPPLRSIGGWGVALLRDLPVFTNSFPYQPGLSNTSEGYWGYSRNSTNISTVQPTFSTGALRGLAYSKNTTDLRFADTAYVSVDYTGWGLPGDKLKLQVATNEPVFDNWVDLEDEHGNDSFANTSWGQWETSRFSLDGHLHEQAMLRLNFTSGTSQGSAPGFFIRNFEIKAESRYHGLVQYDAVAYVVSTTSFSDFQMVGASANLIRTPAGEILLFSVSYDTSSGIPPDGILFRSFDFFENPQITFAVTVIGAYLIAYYQSRYFNQFKAAHPTRYRPAASKIKWLHWLGRILIIILILFYFLPGMFAFAAPGFLIGGPAMWALSIVFVVGVALLTKFMYMRQAKYIPPEGAEELPEAVGIPPPPGAGEAPAPQFCADCLEIVDSPGKAYTCECGKTYHKLCASELKECPECHRKMQVELPKEKLMTVQCPTCREIQNIREGADLSRTKCSHCDTVLRALDEGLNYLVIDKDPSTSYSWFLGMIRRERSSLLMSTAFPEKVKREYNLTPTELYWLSDTNPGPKTLDPKRLDFEVIRAISNFVRAHKGAAMLLDGLEYVVVENGFDKTFKFIKKVNDLCSVHGATFIVPISPGALGPDELEMLRKEFDRIEELVAPPPPPPAKGK